jgi:N-acetylglucosamine malate deacetylase 1
MNEIRYMLPDVERALVLSPHPDDETLGCGGIIALYSGKVDFTVVAVSNGEAVNIPEQDKIGLRREEFSRAMNILGVRDFVFLDFPDGKFSLHSEKIMTKISELYASFKPQIVFSPSPFDPHSDHREIAQSCIMLAARFPSVKVAFYEVYGSLRFNTLLDIGPVIDIKQKALSQYHFSMLKKESIFIEANRALNRSRSLFPLRASFYEAFWIPDSPKELFDFALWATYGTAPSSPEDRLLSTLSVADRLIDEIRNLELRTTERNAVIDELQLRLGEKKSEIEDLEAHLKMIERSLLWRLSLKIYKLRDALFRDGRK